MGTFKTEFPLKDKQGEDSFWAAIKLKKGSLA